MMQKKQISKNEGYFFGQHPLVEKSPTVTDMNILVTESLIC